MRYTPIGRIAPPGESPWAAHSSASPSSWCTLPTSHFLWPIMLLYAQMASLAEMRRAASAQCEASENAAGIDRKRLEAEAMAQVEAAKRAASEEREAALAAAAVRQDRASK